MDRLYIFLIVGLVAVVGIVLQMQASSSGMAISPRCAEFALELDTYIRNTIPPTAVWEKKPGVSSQEIFEYNPCTGEDGNAIRFLLEQKAPLEDYSRTEWEPQEGQKVGDSIGFMGGPEQETGNIQYIYCAKDRRAQVVMSGVFVCDTL